MKGSQLLFLTSVVAMSMAPRALAATAPVCTDPPSFVEAKHFEGVDFNHLPERVFVARTLEVWAANRDKGYKLMARHNFKSMKSEVRCSKSPYEGSVNLTAWVPALVDLSHDKRWGDSVWQFQALLSTKRVGIWNQKSRLAPVDEVRRISQKGTWRALDLDSYELIWEQSVNGTPVFFRVIFDVMS